MTPDQVTPETRALMDKLLRAWNGEPDLVFEVFGETFINHTAWGSLDPGRQGIHDLIVACRTSFPDLVVTSVDAFQWGPKISSRARFVATHLGAYGPIAPTGRRVTWEANAVYWVKDGKLDQEWSIANEVVLLAQLGIDALTPAVARVNS